jgi:hypothetical protein
MNVLKFRTFDEKRAITPKWVMGFKCNLNVTSISYSF